MIIDKFKLEKTGITTYTHDTFIGDVEFSVNKIEYRRKSSLNADHLAKKGNFQEWDFYIYQLDKTDAEWNTMVDSLEAFNCLGGITFTPDTVGEPTENIKIYFWCMEDLVNDYDVKKIKIKIIRMYSVGNEPV